MATGYTYPVIEKDISFAEFVWDCARGFGAFLHMRDEGLGAQIVYPEPNHFYQDQLKNLEEELRGLKEIRHAAILERQKKIRQSIEESNRKWAQSVAQENGKLQAMLDQVQRWVPPTKEHDNLKAFMVEQLKTSMHDMPKFTVEPVQSPEEWRKEQIEITERQLERYRESAKKEIQGNNEVRLWIDALRASVPPPTGKFK